MPRRPGHVATYPWPGPIVPRKHVVVAYLWWFFLGAFGAHRFYLGRPVSGLLYVLMVVLSPATLFLSLPVLALCVFVDLFRIPGLTRRANRRWGWPV